MNTVPPTLQTTLTTLLAALTLAACGGGGNGGTAAKATAASASEAGANADADADAGPPLPDLTSVRSSQGGFTGVSSVLSAPAETSADTSSSWVSAATSAPPRMRLQAASGDGESGSASVRIYVSTDGNDNWSGALAAANEDGTDGPVKTLQAAQARARSQLVGMAAGSPRYAVRVLIAPGTYPMTAPLNLTQLDSGTAEAPMSYEAITPGTVVLSGGVALVQRSAASAGQPAVFEVPAAAQGTLGGGGQLFVNGRRATLARQPNAGQYYFIQKATPLASEPTGAQGRTAFAPAADALSWVNALPSADRERAVVNILHAWTSSQHHLAASAPEGSVQVAPSANWTFLNSGVSQRYFIENVAQALDAAGEWYGDDSGIRYLPTAEESGAGLNAVLPVLDKLVTVSGNMNLQAWAQYIAFKGLTFAHTRYLTPAGGYLDAQAAAYVGAAIEVDSARNITIDNCVVTGTARYGVWFRRAVTDSKVTNSTLTDLGAGGVQMGQVVQNLADPLATGGNAASGNVIGETGKLFPGAVGVWVGQGFDNLVANNLIYNTTYSAVSMGWTWGYGDSASGRNSISGNLLANVGQGMLSDMAGIYTVGVSPGSTISGNVIREVRGYPAYGAGAWGIYQDNGSSQTTVVNNIAIGADNGSYQVTHGRDNLVQSNLFGLGDRTELNVAFSNEALALNFSNNLLVPKVVQPFIGYSQSPDAVYSGNVATASYAGAPLDLSRCAAGCTTQTVSLATTTDPRGVSISGTDAATVARIAQTAAGAGPASLANASSVVTVATQAPPVVVAPPITYKVDIAGTAFGKQPLGMWYSTVGTNAPTTVAANDLAPNGRCLQYTDSPSNANSYDPHTYAPLNHASGTTTGSFWLLIDSKTYFQHQWRDNGVKVKTGPSLNVTPAGVWVGGKVVAPVTVGQWMKFSVTAPLASPTGTWSLQVVDGQGAITRVDNLPFATAGWSSLNWWGFVSQATVATSFCLHSVQAVNVQS